MSISQARRNGGRRGNAIIEFALSATVLFTLLFGTFQFGYTFYVYDQLQTGVRSGVRYASLRPYQLGGGGCATTIEGYVKNIVAYGNPSPGANPLPIVKGLKPSNVKVVYTKDAAGKPTQVTVTVTGFEVDALFQTFTFTDKPYATVPFFGRYAPTESCDYQPPA